MGEAVEGSAGTSAGTAPLWLRMALELSLNAISELLFVVSAVVALLVPPLLLLTLLLLWLVDLTS